MLERTSKLDRRSFLKKAAKIFFAGAALMSAGLYLFFAYPKQIRKKKTVYVYACDEDDLPVQGVRPYYLKYSSGGEKEVQRKIFIVNTGKELFCLSPVCTHLGCLIAWYRPENRFVCPCHGGQYDIYGNVTAGPPAAPLNRLPLKIENEKVHIGLKL
jgi:cytochrome b6-f complex iron-sulfur subunit